MLRAPLASGTGRSVQLEPSQRSLMATESESPTAIHHIEEMQTTLGRTEYRAPEGLGVRTLGQPVPSHVSASVLSTPLLFVYEPTAVQSVLDGHEILASRPKGPVGLGVDCTVQTGVAAATPCDARATQVLTTIAPMTGIRRIAL